MKETAVSYPSPRAWMEQNFQKNITFFEKRALVSRAIDWTRKNLLVDSICLTAVKYAISAFAAHRSELAERLLLRASEVLSEAFAARGDARECDEISLDRPAMVLANRLGRVLAPNLFVGEWSVPFEAFPGYIEADGRESEERNAARVLWALFAVFEERSDEYARARDTKLGTHRDLREEMPLVQLVPELHGRADHPGWAMYETVLARWLNPVLTTESYASNFQSYFAGVMSLLWARDHLKSLDRDTLLRTYFGETLSIPVPVE